MPVERLREQFMSDAQMFYPLGRKEQQPKTQQSNNNPLKPEVISIASTASTVSTATTASTASSSASSGAPATRRARPIIYSSDEEDEDEDENDHFEEALQDSVADDDSDIEIEILSGAPPTQHKPGSNLTQKPNQLPKPTAPSRPLQPYNGVNRVPPAPGTTFATPYKPHSLPQGMVATPIHIPSNKDLPNSGSPIKPATFDYERARNALPTVMPQQHQPQQPRAPVASQPVYIPTDASQANEYMSPQETEKALKDLISGNINEDEITEIDPEDKVVDGFKPNITLLDHQVIGRKWIGTREAPEEKRFGGILADDMGLGKTIQTLSRIVDNPPSKADREDGFAPSTLVVCPLSLVGQWADEIKKMTKLTVLKHHGTTRTTDPAQLRKHNVVVTTYDVIKNEYAVFAPEAKDESKKAKAKTSSATESDSDSEAEHFGRNIRKPTAYGSKKKKKDAIFQVKWWRIVLDEAHTIKNHKTKGAVACCELKGRFKWCLTGTPLQNNVEELYSLLKFLHIRPWNELDRFNRDLAQPIKKGVRAGPAMKRLQVILKQIMLRRRKDDTLNGKKLIDLPKRTVEIVSCPFDSSERAFYTSLENKMDETLEKLLNSDGKGGSKYMSVLLLLLRLRQACNHPLLITKDYKKDIEAVDSQAAKQDSQVDADDLATAFGQLGVTRKCQLCMTELSSRNAGQGKWNGHCVTCVPLAEKAELAELERPTSAKIRMILKLLQDIDERSDGEEKTIIFSQFTSMLDLIMPFLKDKGIRFSRYDGSMNPAEREAALNKIKTDPKVRVILISFKAGSTGLNLTACNNVILVDLWWNPALEDQAFDRAHRFGQKRDVNIYKLKIDETVEERILLLQDKKRALAHAALSGDKLKNMKLGMDDLLALFRHNARDDSDDEAW
ncbi:hypothetical protein NP233_g10474 [Leucocoprinus birnbaumii]|uniref:Uncharacterized protein n=1 Tax=Leucocoprinus birnbaumii TaxID=56174 RepID=A0AAD5VKP3_9AGAR|nr:hypothetical protein NP233_g10474 [Leucocoprinus birnbaumii]